MARTPLGALLCARYASYLPTLCAAHPPSRVRATHLAHACLQKSARPKKPLLVCTITAHHLAPPDALRITTTPLPPIPAAWVRSRPDRATQWPPGPLGWTSHGARPLGEGTRGAGCGFRAGWGLGAGRGYPTKFLCHLACTPIPARPLRSHPMPKIEYACEVSHPRGPVPGRGPRATQASGEYASAQYTHEAGNVHA